MIRIVLCNCPPEVAEPLARSMVEQRIAACVNLSAPIRSVYRWKGAIETADEITLTIKLPAENIPALRALVGQEHPYQVPEFLVLDVDPANSSSDYLSWIHDVTLGGQ
jgi:periplasmic divalent cation tolerance protein